MNKETKIAKENIKEFISGGAWGFLAGLFTGFILKVVLLKWKKQK